MALWSTKAAIESGDNAPAIEVSDATVSYRTYKDRPTSLKEAALRLLLQGKLRHFETFNALQNITITVKQGEILGVIGSNGAGKSTLLKILAQVLRPTTGQVRVKGVISSLIELGVGFDPELNAIENIYLNGSLYKKTRAELRSRIEPILEFADLKDFAETPIKYYSSGMGARLGFSAAIDIDPEVLLVDEILSVGDERFQEKCYGVFQRFFESRKTIVMVSHNLAQVEKLCHKVALLSKGRLVFLGDPHEAVAMYRDKSYETALNH